MSQFNDGVIWAVTLSHWPCLLHPSFICKYEGDVKEPTPLFKKSRGCFPRSLLRGTRYSYHTVNLLVCHFVCSFVYFFLHMLNHSFTFGIKGIKNFALTDPPCFQRYPSLLRTCKCQEIQIQEFIFH